MKCPECGADNLAGAGVCRDCGKLITARADSRMPGSGVLRSFGAPARSTTSAPTQVFGKLDHNDVAQRMRMEYSDCQRDANARTMDAVIAMLQHFYKPQMSIRGMLEEAANLIQRQFAIREIAVGLRNSSDGMYRYEVILGYREEAEKAHRTLQYSEKDFWDESRWKSTTISRQTRLFLTEDTPYLEKEKPTYNRQAMLGLKRTALNECLEADYLDTTIPGQGGEAAGWIEFSGTRGGKLPDAQAIKWIEFIACILGAAIVCYDIRRIMARESAKKVV